ncbi:MAG: DUF4389 domain-containing protein [Actinobacteria bacterium]|nr:DUF4389 domain-containing protein [Actinomycetota bacterium]
MRTEVETFIDPQLGKRNRLTTLFRPILAVPAIFLVSLISPSHEGAGVLPILIAIVIVIFGIYPIWMIAFTHGILEFATKTNSYLFLLTDAYPNFIVDLKVRVVLPDIAEGKNINRWLPLVKWILALPHYLIIVLAATGVYAVVLFNWITILITGNYSGSGQKFIVGYISYINRVAGYAFAMVTDSYPRIITR